MEESRQQGSLRRQIPQMQNEIVGLRIENQHLKPMKYELARLRASIADSLFKLSEQCEVRKAE